MDGDPDRFWELTPTELFREFAALSNKELKRFDEHIWTAWHGAWLARVEKFPKLNTLLPSLKVQKKTAPQTPEQQLAVMQALFIAAGGKAEDMNVK